MEKDRYILREYNLEMENALWAVKLIFIWVSIKLTREEKKKQRKKYGEKKKLLVLMVYISLSGLFS